MMDRCIVTMTLNDILLNFPDVLDFMVLDTTEHTEKFKTVFVSKWNFYEVNYETVDLFKRRCSDYFEIWKDYYIHLLTTYAIEVEELAGLVETEHVEGETTDTRDEESSATTAYGATSNSTYYDLPNGDSDGYPTNTSESGTGGSDTLSKTYDTDNKVTRENDRTTSKVNVIEQRELVYKHMHNLMLEFAERFSPCFCKVYL